LTRVSGQMKRNSRAFLFLFLLSALTAGNAFTQHTISGTVTEGGLPLAGVVMSGLPGSPVTASDGTYNDTVSDGWSGTVTPTLAGYTFTPSSIPYSNVTADLPGQDYEATVTVQFTAVSSSGDEGTGVPNFQVSLSAVSNVAVRVDYETSGGTATAGEDYTASSGTLEWLPGDTTDKTDHTGRCAG